jgi:hypothetical protein
VRHVRILGLSLAAVFALTATTLIVASPALAEKCNQECKETKKKETEEAKKHKEEEKVKKEKEKELKKHPEGEFEEFNECPIGAELVYEEEPKGSPQPLSGCIHGVAGSESYFQAGKVTIYFKKPVALEIGFFEEYDEHFKVTGARNGDTISKEAEPAPTLTEGLDAEKLGEPEKQRYEEYIAAGKSTKVTETIELATPGTDIYLNEDNILLEEGEGFGFDVMIHIENKFLGNNCYVGSTVHPVDVPFTTGETHPEPPNTPIHGARGEITSNPTGEILIIRGQHLVNNEYAAPGVSGCGINGGADAALDAGLGLPSPAGSNTTVLVGTLYQTGAASVEEHLKDG